MISVFKKSLLATFFVLFASTCYGVDVHPHGYWYGDKTENQHAFDPLLANALAQFFQEEGALSVADFGCGLGYYVKLINDRQIQCDGYDGNPDTPELTKGLGQVADLSQSVDLGKTYDWVLSLEVGEHIPKKYEQAFIENLHEHNAQGIVLSWAVKGQGGYGHFNEQNNAYIKSIMSDYGYINDVEAEQKLRKNSHLFWFKNTVMVFRKQVAG